MSHEDFTRELYLYYIKLGNTPKKSRKLAEAALDECIELVTPPRINFFKDFGLDQLKEIMEKQSSTLMPYTQQVVSDEDNSDLVSGPAESLISRMSKLHDDIYMSWNRIHASIAKMDADVPPFKSTEDGVVHVVVLKDGGGTEVVPLTLDIVKSGKVLWQELNQAGIQTQEQLDLFLEDFYRSQEAKEAIRACDKPENFHTSGPDSFKPAEKAEEQDEPSNPFQKILFKGVSTLDGLEMEGFYIYSTTTRKHYITKDVKEGFNGDGVALDGWIEVDPSTLSYRIVDKSKPGPHA